MIQLMGFFTQNTKKVLYVLEELGTEYEFQFVDLMKGEQKTPEIASLNPFQKVPILLHDGKSLFESGAICRYLGEIAQSDLYPKNVFARAQVDQWMDFFSVHLGRWFNSLYYESFLKPLIGQETDSASCQEATKFINQQVKILDDYLGNNKFLAGDRISIADLFAYAYGEQDKDCGISLDHFKNYSRWMSEIKERPAIGKALGELRRFEYERI